jgi:hypothetical protein
MEVLMTFGAIGGFALGAIAFFVVPFLPAKSSGKSAVDVESFAGPLSDSALALCLAEIFVSLPVFRSGHKSPEAGQALGRGAGVVVKVTTADRRELGDCCGPRRSAELGAARHAR